MRICRIRRNEKCVTSKKSIKVRAVEVAMYDRVAKEERTETFNVSEVEKLPANCVLIEHHDIPGSEKEVVYTMTPETFVANAK